jgi:hypothetical protein
VEVSYVQWHFILEEIVVAGQGETIHLQWRNILHHFGHCKADTEKFWRLVYQASWMLLGCMTCLLFDAFVLPTLFTVHWGRQRQEVATKEQGVRLLKLAAFGLHPRGDVMFGQGDQFTCNQETHCVNWSLWNCKAFGGFGGGDWRPTIMPWARCCNQIAAQVSLRHIAPSKKHMWMNHWVKQCVISSHKGNCCALTQQHERLKFIMNCSSHFSEIQCHAPHWDLELWCD